MMSAACMNSCICFCRTLLVFEDIHSFFPFVSRATTCLVTIMVIDNLQPLAYAISSVMFVIGTTSFFIRFYCRAVVKNVFGWDDTLSIFLLVCFINQPLTSRLAKQTTPQKC